MAAIFNGITTSENIEKFFLNMIVSDCNMPHTTSHLSPITFVEFMARNQIVAFNMFDIYDEACKAWVKFQSNGTNVIGCTPSRPKTMEKAEEEQTSWHPLIDHLKRLLFVSEINSPYYKMHYIALVCNNFYRKTDTEGYDVATKHGYRFIWNQIIEPILYDPLIPTNYFWLPIKNYTDLRFTDDVETMVRRSQAFLASHTGSTADFDAYDKARQVQYRTYIERFITAIYTNKYNDPATWQPAANLFFNNCLILSLDMTLHEMANTPMFITSGFQSLKTMDRIKKLRQRYEKGQYVDDADGLIDKLLDIMPRDVEAVDSQDDKSKERAIKYGGCEGNKKGGDDEAQYVKA